MGSLHTSPEITIIWLFEPEYVPYVYKIAIHTNFWKFEYPCAIRYADFIGFSAKPHLNEAGAAYNPHKRTS